MAAPNAFVGRARELSELREALKGAERGRGALFLVTGEPGIGKSRLTDELAEEARATGAHAVWGRCWEAGGAPPYWPWTQALRALERDGARVPHPDELAADERDPEAARFAFFDAVATALADASRAAPLVVVLEDLHVADRSSLMLLRFVAGLLRDTRILLLGTYRDVEARRSTDVAGLLGEIAREGRTIHLSGLAERDTAALVEATLNAKPDQRTVREVHHATEGNPFFVHEVARLLAVERAPRIPDGVREAIARRVSLLPAETTDLLALATVIGRDFSLDLLTTVAGLGRDEVLARLEPALEIRLVLERGLLRYAFSHALVRDALYDRMPGAERASRHARVAEALVAAGELDEHAAEIAHHFVAGASATDPEHAVAWSLRAADRALAHLAYDEAVGHIEHALRGLDLLPPDDRRRAEAMLSLAGARWRAGDLAEARIVFERAAELARRLGDDEVLARAALGRAEVDLGGAWTRGWVPDPAVVGLLEEAIDAIGDADASARARLLARLSAELHFSERPERSADLAEEAVRVAKRSGDAETIAYALTARHLAVWGTTPPPERVAIADEMVRMADDAGRTELLMQAHAWRQTDLLDLGDVEAAQRDVDAYRRLASASRRPQYKAYLAMMDAGRALFEGRFEEGVALSEQARAFGRQAEDTNIYLSATVQVAHVYALRGRIDEALRLLDEYGAQFSTAVHVAAKGWTLWHAEDVEGVRRMLHELVGTDRVRFPRDVFFHSVVTPVAEPAAWLGDRRRCALLRSILEDRSGYAVTAGRNAPLRYGAVDRYLGVLNAALGDLDEAARALERALALNDRMGGRPWVAYGKRDLAEVLLARGDRAGAEELLRDARSEAEAMRLPFLLARVDALATRLVNVNTFMREGEMWAITFEGTTVRVRDVKGIAYLLALLARPGDEVHVLEVAGGGGNGHGGATEGLPARRLDEGMPVLDEEARASYRRRIAELREEAEQAREWNDPERAARAEEELDAIAAELGAATGLGGRTRIAASAAERARVNVTKQIRAAIERIARHHPPLGEHLRVAVRTGTFCSYAPAPPVAWRL